MSIWRTHSSAHVRVRSALSPHCTVATVCPAVWSAVRFHSRLVRQRPGRLLSELLDEPLEHVR
jgi:hypothetical protein